MDTRTRGGYWELHCEEQVKLCGFEPLGDCCEWRSVYWNETLRVMLSIYVDDFKLAGAKAAVKQAWEALGKRIELGKVSEVAQYLGCTHRVRDVIWKRCTITPSVPDD